MSGFRDTIAATLWLGGDLDVPGHSELVAEQVLAMPEMQAIRLCLFRMAIRLADDHYDGVVRDVFTNYGLPESVIEWMSAES